MTKSTWLSRIQCPADLKGLRLDALQETAQEIRCMIAETCSKNGGHFAPSLGVVELTIALHYAFEAPQDKIVWDVGHQAYAHKLLTGRAGRFHTLRQLDGISGFPKRDESPYDPFGAGHSSTSISAAFGIAMARDHLKKRFRVAAVCGDGAMTGGLCYEALNNVGYFQPDMLIVLNDNEMSISPNIGAMAHYFNHLITTEFYNKSKSTAEDLIKRVPTLGERVLRISHRLERSLKELIVSEETIFEKMGIRYLGPIDGHDLERLIEVFEHVRDLKGPILLHVKTVKGKGYEYSESDPERWHSGVHFAVDTGKKVESPPFGLAENPPAPTFTEAFARHLIELAERDERIVAVTAAMPTGTGLDAFAERFPKRCHDVGIAEPHAACFAAGLAAEGLRPVVAVYSSFLQRAFDQIIHDVALQNLPVTFAIDRAGLVGDDGPTHHGVFDLSYLRMIPGIVVAAPRDERELGRVMAAAAAWEEGPFAYRYPRARGLGVDCKGALEPVEVGTGEILREPAAGLPAPGEPRVAILSIGTMASCALAAAKRLESEGVATTVADMRFVKPLDRALLTRLHAQSDLLVTLEENAVAGGFGSAVNEALLDMGLPGRALTFGIPDRWIEQGPIPELLRRCGLDPESVAARVRDALAARSETSAEPHVAAK